MFKANGRPVTPGDQKLSWTSLIGPWASKNHNSLYKEGHFLNISGRLRENFSLKHCITHTKPLFLCSITDLRDHIRHVEKAVSTKEPRFMSRALRALVSLRRKLNQNVLRKAIMGYFLNSPNKDSLLDYMEEVSQTGVNFFLLLIQNQIIPYYRSIFIEDLHNFELF